MLYSVLAVGDVVGEAGLAHLERHLRPLQKLKNISFTVVNGENISGVGLTCKQAWRVYDAGADAVTLGNHTFGKMEICRMLDETPWLLRPANLSGRMPGHGCEIFDLNGLRFRVVNLIGRCTLQWNAENPFTLADRLLKQGTADFTLVDFHAEATSEKLALGYYLDGRVSALWGTHTHVPTADGRVCPKGMGYLTDLGMTGPAESVLGVRPEHLILSGDEGSMIHGTVDVSEMMGSAVHLHVSACGSDTIMIVPTTELESTSAFTIGSPIAFTFNGAMAHLFDRNTQKNLEV